jgi:hypothetical protein
METTIFHIMCCPEYYNSRSQNYDIHTWQKHQYAAPLRHKVGPRPGLVPVKM